MLTRRIQAVLVPAVLGMILTQTCDLRAADGPAVVRITDRGVPFSYAGQVSFAPSGEQIVYSSSGSNRSFMGWSGYGDTHPPNYGWSRNRGNPVVRTPVEYRRYWPARWYGEPGSGLSPKAKRFPVVYMPSDTTQLGAYYQRVPTWLPNPAMLPVPPHSGLSNGQCEGCIGGSVSEQSFSDPGSKATTPTPAPTPPPLPGNNSAFNSNGATRRF